MHQNGVECSLQLLAKYLLEDHGMAMLIVILSVEMSENHFLVDEL